ncbi:MAG: CRISPR-associated protein Csx3 [Thermodesulfovibrionales bacterium]
MEQKIIDVSTLYADTETAKLSQIDFYIEQAKALAGEGNDIILTGQGPIWLYLKIAHALHGKARKLIYRSPVTGDVVIFDHSPD